MTSLSKSITSSEESSSSSTKVDQSALFTEVTKVINEKFTAATSSSPATPGDIMFVVVSAVNEKLKSTLVETAELYSETTSTIYKEFKDIKSTTESSNKEAKSIFLTTSSLADGLSKISTESPSSSS